ncbi:alpha/beta hydrolase [Bacillus sp. EB600]|uniref:RBBP9/YdeN family alpha/beta hydrolase n=1 Tax=Bacillus sp. EB600 TaxID=2806345 RepID=UPI00210B6FCF|nr:alpha/beta hydrolase [Bacillus sp. EB600]MCQ6278822.1 alpha/beta fold hydrolase [Bacillus sp. EB600]
MTEYSFVIIHGLGGSGLSHWQTWLANTLKQHNFNVVYPVFSKFNRPNKDVWLKELKSTLDTVPKHHKKIIITHSLGGLLWQHYAAAVNYQIADQVILVAPPSPAVVIPAAKSFFPVPLSRKNLTRISKKTLFIHSTNDPFCSMEDARNYYNFNLPSIILQNHGHINVQSGHGKWPLILDLCMKMVKKNEEVCI